MVDSSALSEMSDDNKKDFMENFVIPEGTKLLQSKLQVTSTSIIPAFNAEAEGCDDEGNISIDSKYASQVTEGDFLLFVGSKKLSDDVEGYAGACLLGNDLFFFFDNLRL